VGVSFKGGTTMRPGPTTTAPLTTFSQAGDPEYLAGWAGSVRETAALSKFPLEQENPQKRGLSRRAVRGEGSGM